MVLFAALCCLMAADITRSEADAFFERGQYKQAADAYIALLRSAPSDRGLVRSLAAALQEANQFAEASQLLGQLTTSDPKDAESWRRLGLLMYRNGYYGAAIEDLDRALALGIEPDSTRITRAISLMQTGRA